MSGVNYQLVCKCSTEKDSSDVVAAETEARGEGSEQSERQIERETERPQVLCRSRGWSEQSRAPRLQNGQARPITIAAREWYQVQGAVLPLFSVAPIPGIGDASPPQVAERPEPSFKLN